MKLRALLVVLILALLSCAGMGQPFGRPLPVVTKADPDYGSCVSSGYEISFPPVRTFATIVSVCERPFSPSDAGADDASAPAPASSSSTEGGAP